jgi:adenylate cyclase
VFEEEVISAAQALISGGGFADREDRQRFEKLLKDYQKLFRTTCRLMRLSDRNEQQLNALSQEQRHANEIIALKNKELEALSKKLSKYLSPQIYHSIFTGAPRGRDRVHPQEADRFLLRHRRFHQDHRQA